LLAQIVVVGPLDLDDISVSICGESECFVSAICKGSLPDFEPDDEYATCSSDSSI
jgi:hypothetical protein